jgi:hypothetical protein
LIVASWAIEQPKAYGQDHKASSPYAEQTEAHPSLNAAARVAQQPCAREGAQKPPQNGGAKSPWEPFHTWLDRWHVAFELLFAAAVAAFTAYLGLVTRNLWTSTEGLKAEAKEQRGALEESVAAAVASADAAQKALVLAHRPWIPDRLEIIEPIRVGKHGIDLKVRFYLRNIGNSPAYQVDPSISLTHSPDAGLTQALLSARAAIPVTSGQLGFTLFPGAQEVPIDVNVSLPRATLERYRKAQVGTLFVPITIVGAIFYRGLDNQLHQTGVGYELKRANAADPNLPLMIDMDGADVPVTDIRLYKSITWQPQTN